MRLALRSPTLPSRRRSRRQRILGAGTKAVKAATAVKVARGAAGRRVKAVLPLLSLGALVMFMRKKLRVRRDDSLDAQVDAPAAVSETPRPAAEDPSPANPETDLPAAPNGSADTEEARDTAKAAVADVDGPNEGATGHEPS